MTDTTASKSDNKGFLAWVERTGNRLPDPVFIFFYLILFLVVISVVVLLGALTFHCPHTCTETNNNNFNC